MRFSLLCIFLLATVNQLLASQTRLEPFAIPQSQTVTLNLDPAKDVYSGQVDVVIDIPHATKSIQFHALELALRDGLLIGNDATLRLSSHQLDNGIVEARSETMIAPGQYRLHFSFDAHYNKQAVGLYQVKSGGENYLFTQFEMSDARRAFPVWDEPIYKIPFQLKITVPAHLTVVSNTPPDSDSVASGQRQVVFKQTRPLPSYLVAIAVGNFDSVDIPNMSVPGKVYTVKGQSHLAATSLAMAAPLLSALEAYFGRPYPYAKLDMIAVPEYAFGAMENAGLVTFRDDILLAPPLAIGAPKKQRMANVIAHEFAHMWYGDLVTMAWWNDLWLNEAFATWMSAKITHQIFPELRSDLNLRQSGGLAEDARATSRPIRKEIKTEADVLDGLGLAYSKGMTILQMVESWIGEEAFRQGIIDYQAAFEWRSATAEDLWSALSNASGEDTAAVFKSFLDQPGFPLIEVKWENNRVQLLQTRFRNYAARSPDQSWAVPVWLAYGNDAEKHYASVMLTDGQASLTLPSGTQWLLPNANAIGFYRWQLPVQALQDLARHAKDRLSERERVAFLDNAGALVNAGKLEVGEYLVLLSEFSHDPQPLVISAMISALADIRTNLLPAERDAEFSAYVNNVLKPALKTWGLVKKSGEPESVSALRPKLLRWLGQYGHNQAVITFAATQQALALRDATSVDPSLLTNVLRLAALRGDDALYRVYKEAYESETRPSIKTAWLRGLGNFAAPALREKSLAYSLTDAVRPTDFLRQLVNEIAVDESGSNLVNRWMLVHHDAIVQKAPPFYQSFFPQMLPLNCSSARKQAAEEFFSHTKHQVSGSLRSLAKAAQEVDECIALKARMAASMHAYFDYRLKH